MKNRLFNYKNNLFNDLINQHKLNQFRAIKSNSIRFCEIPIFRFGFTCDVVILVRYHSIRKKPFDFYTTGVPQLELS